MGAMDWLKGMIAPAAQFPGQPGFGQNQGGPPMAGGLAQGLGAMGPLAGALGNPLGNPLGGMMGAAFAPPQGGDPYGGQMGPGNMGGPPIGGAPPMDMSGMGGAYGSQGGYPTAGDAFASNAGYGAGYGGSMGTSGPPGGPPPGAPQMPGQYAPQMPGGMPMGQGAGANVAALEAQVAELRHDVEALALFSRTLLTVMLDRKILSVEQFQETKNKIDLLDGKLDDRVAK